MAFKSNVVSVRVCCRAYCQCPIDFAASNSIDARASATDCRLAIYHGSWSPLKGLAAFFALVCVMLNSNGGNESTHPLGADRGLGETASHTRVL